ncbi:MAG: amidohydrolase/deacetylase family metallohydrolase [Paracoccaceae bacterium]|nr:amidohydrolase/deacetylase family metallohydrolase [Paracoccaceae bacterium]
MSLYDLVLKGGHVVDPSQRINKVQDIAFSNGKVAKIDTSINAEDAKESRDVSKSFVVPGLIDLHTHVYWGGTSLGIDADDFCRHNGVTTAVDTGSSGPGNFAGFRKHVIEKSDVRILAYLHVSHAGVYAFSDRVMVGESKNLDLMDPITAIEVVNENRDVIVGIKVRLGRIASGVHGTIPYEYALQVAEETGLPIMVHIDEPPPSYAHIVSRLRKGDILTHCFRPFPNTPIMANGKVLPEVIEARERGVIFDIGHGKGSFSFEVAKLMLENNFHPDVISSDVHALCINGPAFDQLTTLSKFLILGVPFYDVIAQSTVNAAKALNRPELGTFKTGAVGDVTLLRIDTGSYDYIDVKGETLVGDRKIELDGVVLNGKWWHSA